MQAVILAGGQGTRLRPYTTALPKPLVPVGGLPILEILLRQLKRRGCTEAVLAVGHLAGLIRAYCGRGRQWGLRIRYHNETRPLGTAGALRAIRGLRPRFLVLNGDILTDLDFRALHRHHERSGAWATLGAVRRESRVDYGVLELARDGSLARYIEKPRLPYLVSMGINVLERRAVSLIRPGEALGIPDLAARIMASGGTVACYRARCRWLDIGRPEDYEAASALFARAPSRFLGPA